VVAEALATSFTLATVTGEQSYADRHEKLCAHADTFFIDHARGSWRHELNLSIRPSCCPRSTRSPRSPKRSSSAAPQPPYRRPESRVQ
jgi:hypothetical protein